MIEENIEIIIRKVQISDIEKLKCFFVKAYGENTVFKNEKFLFYFFDASINNKDTFSNCLIGLIENGDIVSHYGGLEYNIKINNKIYSMTWGVSAYTLFEYREKGTNSKILEFINKNNEINGVIGFTNETALFYKKIDYNIFKFEKFSRYVLILDFDKTLEVCNYINQNAKYLIENQKTMSNLIEKPNFYEIIELTTENIEDYNLNFDEDFSEILTTHRSKDFLKWRFFKNPFLKYTLYGLVSKGSLIAYIALREEILEPFTYKVNRIIDLYGKIDSIKTLLYKTFIESLSKNHIYIDFSMFGTVYEKELKAFNFINLKKDNYSILPQVTAPIEDRSNREFIGLKSKFLPKVIKNLSVKNVYFTRMDSDRDRLAKIN